jgi:hypothetical protein
LIPPITQNGIAGTPSRLARGYDRRSVPEHESFCVIRRNLPERGTILVTVLHEVPEDAEALGSFADPGAAIDFAQAEVRRLNAGGVAAEYVDPPEDLVGTG